MAEQTARKALELNHNSIRFDSYYGFSFYLINQIDSAMMGYLGQTTQTGWYNAASKIAKVSAVAAPDIQLVEGNRCADADIAT